MVVREREREREGWVTYDSDYLTQLERILLPANFLGSQDAVSNSNDALVPLQVSQSRERHYTRLT